VEFTRLYGPQPPPGEREQEEALDVVAGVEQCREVLAGERGMVVEWVFVPAKAVQQVLGRVFL